MSDILDKDFKVTVLKMPKRLKGDMEKVKKIMCKQNGNINKEKTYKEPKRNSGAEKYN